MLNLNAKERMLLQDEKSHEELCIKKYQDSSAQASDPQLKNLFTQLAEKEQQHLNTINQMLSGTVPNINTSQSGGQQQGIQNQNSQQNTMNNIPCNTEHDKLLCQDALSVEKFVSSTYNTAIFEFRYTNARQVLNHIQKEEQEHGEQLYNYMHQHGMY